MDGQRFDFLPEEIGLLDAEPESDYDNLTSLAADLLHVPCALFTIMQPHRGRLFFKSHHGLEEPWQGCREFPLDESFCQHVQKTEEPFIVRDALADPVARELRAVDQLGVVAYMGVPIRGPDGNTIGSFCVADNRPRDWSSHERGNLDKLASAMNNQVLLRAALRARDEQLDALEQEMGARKKAEAELLRLATTDPLTGALNRRALFDRATSELARSERYEHEVGIAVIDLDHFKKVNDRHGHPVGDAVLKAVSERLQASIRDKIDVLARIGGEEFCVLLPETNRQACLRAAERMRRELEANPVVEDISVTASIGVALRREGDQSFHDMLGRADKALYAAKDDGRNCVRLHDGEAPQAPENVPANGAAAAGGGA